MSAVVAELQNAGKNYWMGPRSVSVLNHASLTILQGEYVAILGPSGSGKSTLLNILGLMDCLDEGRYILAGQDTSSLDDDQRAFLRNSHTGFVFQSFDLLPQLDVLGNIEVPMHYRGLPKGQRRRRAGQLADRVGLSDRLHHRPRELSGGERQRVAIARALANEPALLLADEPTGNLDEATGLAILDLFDELVSSGKTIIMVTHNLEYCQRVHRVLRIHGGVLIDGGPGEVTL
jgi:putative ABC transport system ATP-binding protein